MTGLRELLLFYRDAGVDAALGEVATNHFVETSVKTEAPATASPAQPAWEPAGGPAPQARRGESRAPQPAAAGSSQPALAVPDNSQAVLARDLAAGAASLAELREAMEGFDGCNLKFTASRLVFGDGSEQAPLMVIGEAPGREEDLEGLPFVGRSGRLLDRMLAAIGRDRSNTRIANVIPWRPPGNRTPTAQETEICRPFIERQIELVAPRLVLTLGGPAARVLLGTSEGIMRVRGKWQICQTASGFSVDAMPSLHPAYLLRNPAHKRLAWQDLLEVRSRLGEA